METQICNLFYRQEQNKPYFKFEYSDITRVVIAQNYYEAFSTFVDILHDEYGIGFVNHAQIKWVGE